MALPGKGGFNFWSANTILWFLLKNRFQKTQVYRFEKMLKIFPEGIVLFHVKIPRYGPLGVGE
jgi:hypothetical protein